MANVFAVTQASYRFYEDGPENTATELGAAADTPLTLQVTADTNILLRIRFNESGAGNVSGAATDDYQLQRSIDGAAFANVTTTSTAVKVNTGSALTDGAATTARLGSATAGIQEDGNGEVTNYAGTGNSSWEHVWGLTVVAAETSQDTALTFQVLLNGALFTAITGGAYPVTPTINVSETISATVNPLTGTVALSGLAPTVTADSAVAPTIGMVAIVGEAPTVTVTADATAEPGAGIISVRGYAPDVPQGLTERLSPNTILAGGSNLQDTDLASPPALLSDLADETSGSPGPDALWWTAVNPEADIDVRLGFPTSSGNLVGTQQLRVLIRGTSLPSRDVTLELWEAGAPAPGSPTVTITEVVNSTSGQIVTLSFDASELSDPTGAGVELRIFATAA